MTEDAIKKVVFPDVKTTIEGITTIKTGEPGEYSLSYTIDVFFENQGAQKSVAGRAYCSVQLVPEDVEGITFGNPGNNRKRKTGRVEITVNVGATSGTGLIDWIVKTLEEEYVSKNVGGVKFQVPEPVPGRRVGDDWQQIVNLPFYADRRA